MSLVGREVERLHSVASLASALAQPAELAGVLEIAAEELLRALGAASISISRLEPGSWTLRTIVNAGELGPGETRWPMAEVYRLEDFSHFRPVFHEGHVWFSSTADTDGDTADLALLNQLHKGSSMTAPLNLDGAVWGELYATWHGTEVAPLAASGAYVQALAAVLGSAVSRALHAERLEQLASCDPMTGLANRRALDAAADQTFASGDKGRRRRMSAVALDVNGLKAVNDVHGHEEGDRLLITVAGLLVSSFKPLYGSLVARVGGDEFSVLVPGHPVALVRQAAQAVCVAALELEDGHGVSCGVATSIVRGGRQDQRAVFAAADRAMYDAKRHGIRSPLLASSTDPRGLTRV